MDIVRPVGDAFCLYERGFPYFGGRFSPNSLYLRDTPRMHFVLREPILMNTNFFCLRFDLERGFDHSLLVQKS
jgi:hypothetical protein